MKKERKERKEIKGKNKPKTPGGYATPRSQIVEQRRPVVDAILRLGTSRKKAGKWVY